MRVFVLTLLALLVGLAAPARAQESFDPTISERFDQAVGAYRAGDFQTAETLWRSLLNENLARADRGKVLYNLGNAAYRQDELMESIGWYTSAVRTAPRDREAWANLEFVRLEAELEPADRGDLAATTQRLLESVDEREASWLILWALGAWLLVLVLEAVRGGSLWRRLSLLGVPIVLLACAPLAWRLTHPEVDPVLVVERPSAPLRAEPKDERSPIGQVTAGDVVERIDRLGEWARIELEDGVRGWVPADAIFDLR